MKISDILSSPDKFFRADDIEAKDAEGYCVEYDSPKAVSWSLYGAYWKCHGHSLQTPVYRRLLLTMPPKDRQTEHTVTDFGLNHSYEQCLQLAKDAGL